MTTPSDPLALLRSKSYLALLVLAAIIGVPVSAAAYFFLALVSKLQMWIFTDLPNRALFTARVRQALGGRRASDPGTAVLFIDLDGFKQVNDTIGHQAGDELLIQAGRRLQDSVRAGDTAARLGGDEFAALIMGDGTRDQGAREYQVHEIADRLRLTLSQPYRIGASEARVAAAG